MTNALVSPAKECSQKRGLRQEMSVTSRNTENAARSHAKDTVATIAAFSRLEVERAREGSRRYGFRRYLVFMCQTKRFTKKTVKTYAVAINESLEVL
jgi:hypothetical protein